jgi:hypothetical protein
MATLTGCCMGRYPLSGMVVKILHRSTHSLLDEEIPIVRWVAVENLELHSNTYLLLDGM